MTVGGRGLIKPKHQVLQGIPYKKYYREYCLPQSASPHTQPESQSHNHCREGYLFIKGQSIHLFSTQHTACSNFKWLPHLLHLSLAVSAA